MISSSCDLSALISYIVSIFCEYFSFPQRKKVEMLEI